MNGADDISGLFGRVTALEQDDVDADQTVTKIQKFYPQLGITVTLTYWLHQYRLCGDTNPLYGATCGTDVYM